MTSSVHLPAGSGSTVGFGLTLRVSADLVDGALSIHEGVMQPGETIPPHTHETADQLFYVVSGRVQVTVGDETIVATAGDFVHKPKGVPHTFSNVGDGEARALELTVTDQFQRFTEAVASLEDPDPSDLAEVQRRHGIRFGPPPE